MYIWHLVTTSFRASLLNQSLFVITKNFYQYGAAAVTACFLLVALSSSAKAQSTCSQFGTVSINGGQYIYQQDEWNSSAQQCATVSGTGFTLTTANFNLPTNGAPATYPSIYRGCHWGNCTSSNPFPIQEDNIASASTSVTITQPSGYNNDAAYDIWFNQTSTTSGQPNGTEIMIWINHQGSPQPFGSEVATATSTAPLGRCGPAGNRRGTLFRTYAKRP